MTLLEISSDDRWAIERELCQRSLARYMRKAWPIVEPGRPLLWNWHLDAIAEHLEACARYEIPKLYIAVPPGMMKSLSVSVFFPTWLWTWDQPRRIIGTSYAERLTVRDNLKCLAVIQSDWYQRLWGMDLDLTKFSSQKLENSATGFREAMPFTSLTGSRGDHVLIDDPLSVDDAESPTVRNSVGRTFLEAVPSRVNDQRRSSIIVIQQRLHQDDVIGLCESRELGYEGLVLPMEYDPEMSRTTSIGWRDPRSEPGELLFPEMFDRETLRNMRNTMGAYAWASQMQQRPSPRGGGMFQEGWFDGKWLDSPPTQAEVSRRVRWWDLASTEDEAKKLDPDWTAGVRMSKLRRGGYVIEHVSRVRKSPAGVEKQMAETAKVDGRFTRVRFGREGGATGKIATMYLVRALAGYDVRAVVETKKKSGRADPLAAQCEAGNVWIVRGSWNKEFMDEITRFPTGGKDDQVDAASGAFSQLVSGSAGGPLQGTRSANA